MTEQEADNRRNDARRSGFEMRCHEDRRHEDGPWPYLNKRTREDRRDGDDRRHGDERRHDDPSESDAS